MRTSTSVRKPLAAVIAAALVGAMLALVPVTAANAAPWEDQLPREEWPEPVSADALPTVQIGDGVIWSVEVSGNVAYAGGEFSTARPAGAPAGTGQVSRGNFLAFDVTTGELLPFAPTFNAVVKDVAVTPDGSKLVVVGNFTQVNGQTRNRIAIFDLATGQLASLSRTPDLNGPAGVVAVTDTVAYVGGYFSAVNGESSARLGAVRLTNGNIVTGFRTRFTDTNGTRQPTIPDNQVLALTVNGDGTRLIAGGNFTRAGFANGAGTVAYTTSNGRDGNSQGYGLAMFDTADGSRAIPINANTAVRNAGGNAWLFSLTSDGTYAYGTGGHWGSAGTIEGSFAIDWSDGEIGWIDDCHGDTYDIASVGEMVYTASHKHYCANSGGFPQVDSGWTYYHSTAWSKVAAGVNTPDTYGYPDHPGTAHPQLLYWFPYTPAGSYTGKNQAVWTVDGNQQYVVYGGEFTSVNGTAQQGLVRYTVKSNAPNDEGPRPSQEQERQAHDAGQSFSTWWAPKVSNTIPGTLRASFTTVFDRDDADLTYRVYLDTENASGLVKEIELDTPFWQYQTLSAVASGLEPGSTHRMRVVVSDPYGNSFKSDWVNATVSEGAVSPYVQDIASDSVTHLWRLGESSGASTDVFGTSNLNLAGRMSRGQSGALTDDPNTAITFNNSVFASQNNGNGYSSTRETGPNSFSVEAWFKTTTSSGGKIIGFGSAQTGSSSSYDRHVYMNNSGQLYFGVYPGEVRTINTTETYRDGDWHHVVATLGADGMRLYVDGELAAQRADTTYGQAYDGYWRVGNDTLSGWPSAPSSAQFEGTVDEVAVYSGALSPQRVASHYTVGTTATIPNAPPTASIAAPVVNGLEVSVTGSGSDPDGTIASYAWDFGDGTTATGATATNTYDTAGTYTITLTVTDDEGATGSKTTEVTVAPVPNQAPIADIGSPVVDGLSVTVNGSASNDPDGSIASYAWDFGDGGTASGASATHDYASEGTYTITLTVTDDEGATGTDTHEVVVAEIGAGLLASDDFDRTVSNGWGTADVGGAWTLRGTASRFAVADGAGTMTIPAATAQTVYADLNGVSSTSTRVDAVFSVDALTEGQYVAVVGRRTGAYNYIARLRLQADGGVRMYLLQDGATSITPSVLLPLTIEPGVPYVLSMEVTGTSPTTIKAKAWKQSEAEPAWQREGTNAQADLQAPGAVSLFTYVPNNVAGGKVSFHSVTVTDPN
ncbi:PKD domain-containing protein [Microbacterium sp. CIAB417]|uniref:PKD domain-containing protein n=1 Tax=Microbacterium sp. CIAB417 TaxID=2860287 RepID=UPI001FAD47A5|nr:PKD domain-containing protein [Microbacterium sp. CIAB417]